MRFCTTLTRQSISSKHMEISEVGKVTNMQGGAVAGGEWQVFPNEFSHFRSGNVFVIGSTLPPAPAMQRRLVLPIRSPKGLIVEGRSLEHESKGQSHRRCTYKGEFVLCIDTPKFRTRYDRSHSAGLVDRTENDRYGNQSRRDRGQDLSILHADSGSSGAGGSHLQPVSHRCR